MLKSNWSKSEVIGWRESLVGAEATTAHVELLTLQFSASPGFLKNYGRYSAICFFLWLLFTTQVPVVGIGLNTTTSCPRETIIIMCKNSSTTTIQKADPNAVLEQKVQELIAKAKENKDDDPVLKVASLPKLYDGALRAGTPIYVSRSRFPVYLLITACISFIAWSIYETNLAVFGFCVAGALVGYDMLSGFLHIVFDNPDNLYIPILGQPCLEFQMHHHFPTDLVQRDFLDVVGDLNLVGLVLSGFTVAVFDINDPLIRYMGALKLMMAYYGQFSHRSAHTPSSANNKYITALRNMGLMIPLDKHRSHHRPPHDKDFCLVGVCNPLVNFLYQKVTRNRFFWMVGFFAYGLMGVKLESIVMQKFLTTVGLM